MSDDRETLTEEQIQEDLDEKARRMRAAIRWLSEAKRFRADFGAESWREGAEGDLSEIANITYKEAVRDVVRARKALERARAEYWKRNK